tara:strand:- start:1531 stop:1725 length:195 start_codon:yes stop_codon:yes gene_type:complete
LATATTNRRLWVTSSFIASISPDFASWASLTSSALLRGSRCLISWRYWLNAVLGLEDIEEIGIS